MATRTRPLSLRASLAAIILLTALGSALLFTADRVSRGTLRAKANGPVELHQAPPETPDTAMNAG